MADETVVLEDFRIIFRNFAGEERQFNAQGDRNFTVILDPETAEDLKRQGYNVKQLKPRDDDEPGDWSLKVKVSYKGRTKPNLNLITSRGRTALDEDLAGMLDYAELEKVDLIIRPYDWAVSGKTGRSAYLKTIFAIIREDELELKYSEVPEIGERPALPPGDDPNILDGEIVDEYEDDERPALPRGVRS
jgi:hypothetical protein